jgi:DNA-binding Lrp family transcriptional regulator
MSKQTQQQMMMDEQKVISVLQTKGREDIELLAKHCGFSKQKVRRILHKLDESHKIWGYAPVLDTDKLDMKNYLILIKKTNKPLEKLADIIISRDIEKKSKDLGITIKTSQYLHGDYDWQLSITASNIKFAKKFCEILIGMYGDYIGDLVLLEALFAVKQFGITNPHLKKIKELL